MNIKKISNFLKFQSRSILLAPFRVTKKKEDQKVSNNEIYVSSLKNFLKKTSGIPESSDIYRKEYSKYQGQILSMKCQGNIPKILDTYKNIKYFVFLVNKTNLESYILINCLKYFKIPSNFIENVPFRESMKKESGFYNNEPVI